MKKEKSHLAIHFFTYSFQLNRWSIQNISIFIWQLFSSFSSRGKKTDGNRQKSSTLSHSSGAHDRRERSSPREAGSMSPHGQLEAGARAGIRLRCCVDQVMCDTKGFTDTLPTGPEAYPKKQLTMVTRIRKHVTFRQSKCSGFSGHVICVADLLVLPWQHRNGRGR